MMAKLLKSKFSDGLKPTIPRRLPEELLQPFKLGWPCRARQHQVTVGGGTRGPAVPPALTDEDEPSRLEELLVAPGGVLPLQDVADAVVLTQPERGVHAEPRQEPEHLLTHRQLLLLGDGRRVHHVDRRFGDRGGVHLSIHHLGETKMGW